MPHEILFPSQSQYIHPVCISTLRFSIGFKLHKLSNFFLLFLRAWLSVCISSADDYHTHMKRDPNMHKTVAIILNQNVGICTLISHSLTQSVFRAVSIDVAIFSFSSSSPPLPPPLPLVKLLSKHNFMIGGVVCLFVIVLRRYNTHTVDQRSIMMQKRHGEKSNRP